MLAGEPVLGPQDLQLRTARWVQTRATRPSHGARGEERVQGRERRCLQAGAGQGAPMPRFHHGFISQELL